MTEARHAAITEVPRELAQAQAKPSQSARFTFQPTPTNSNKHDPTIIYPYLRLFPNNPYIAKMASTHPSWRLPFLAVLTFYTALSSALGGQQPLKGVEPARGYNLGEPIPVSCLNRTMYVYILTHTSNTNIN
ncbi:hypothetical protein GQ44DRAFT_501137 [Phaeosphaeriaceae sp. PMI808]|nr:hypothetical protein GQ44DRAFT_501137 [Phaeosphaeriaceae sp. PMI808]